MKKERASLPLTSVVLNEGQLGWLPRNPREWTQGDIDNTAASIQEDPDFLEERPILVVPFGDLYVAFAGNLRHEGALAAKLVEAPCVIHYPTTEEDREAVLRRAMKDNGSFGKFDYDAIANDPVWNKMDLQGMGIKAWKPEEGEGEEGPDEYGEDFNLPNGDGPASNQITFYFAPEQKSFIEDVLAEAPEAGETFGNNNKTGNKLYQIVKEWAASRT